MSYLTPTFNDDRIFGPCANVRAAPHPPARQWDAYPGVNGRQTTYQGTRGCYAIATGVLEATNLADLSVQFSYLEGYLNDGGQYTLIDTKGTPWANMILVEMEVLGDIYSDGISYCVQAYRCRFESTTP